MKEERIEERGPDGYGRIGFTHNVMFREVLRDDTALAKALLERVLGFPIERVEEKSTEYAVDPSMRAKGARFDLYVYGSDKVIDCEMQASPAPSIGKRMRYYQGALDASVLPKGGDYRDLPESYIVFLCRQDPFSRSIPRYSMKPVCEEDPTVEIGSRMHWLAFNAAAFEREKDPGLRSLLCYIEDGTVDESDELVRAIDAKVDALNESDEVREMVWTWQDEIDLQAHIAFEKGEAKGEARGKAEGLAEGEVKGEARLSALISKLLGSDRIDDVKRATTDDAYRQELFKEFGIA